MQKIIVPRLGMSCPGGLVAEWYVPDGGTVAAGQPLFRLEAEFAAIDVEAECDGIVRHRVPAGIPQFSGDIVGVIVAPGEAIPSDEELAALDSRADNPRRDAAVDAQSPAGGKARRADVLPPYEPPRDPVPLRPRRRSEPPAVAKGGLWEEMAGGAPPGFGWDPAPVIGEPPAEPVSPSRPRTAAPEPHEAPVVIGEVPPPAAVDERPRDVPVIGDDTPEVAASEAAPAEPSEPPAELVAAPAPAATPEPAPAEEAAPVPAVAEGTPVTVGVPVWVTGSRHVVRATVALDDAHRLIRALRRQGVAGATVESLLAWSIVRALASEGVSQAAVGVHWLVDGSWSAYEGSTHQPLADVAAALESRAGEPPEPRDAVIVATRGTAVEEVWPGGEFGDVPVVVLGGERWEPLRARGGELQWRFVATVTLSLPAEVPLARAATLLRQVVRSLERPFELLVA